jgi:hypothetical protein
MVTGKAELADWLGASAAVEAAGPVEHAVSERATAARAAVACPAARRKRRLGRARLGAGRDMGFLRSKMRT